MPELTHWKCDVPDCGAICAISEGNKATIGWIKFTVQAALLEPLTVYLCPKHSDEFLDMALLSRSGV